MSLVIIEVATCCENCSLVACTRTRKEKKKGQYSPKLSTTCCAVHQVAFGHVCLVGCWAVGRRGDVMSCVFLLDAYAMTY